MNRQALIVILVSLVLIGLLYCVSVFLPPAALRERSPGRSTLVIIVPGTYGNDGFWPTIVAGQVTFASELKRGCGASTDVYPFLWGSSSSHAVRLAAARDLAKIIDEKAPNYARICLVGHSHGGNIALAAAGMCKSKIDVVVCLSTPQVYLKMAGSDGEKSSVPVYCSWETRENVRKIISIYPETDAVPDFWATWDKGLTDEQAIEQTRGWREHHEPLRLVSDSFVDRLLDHGKSNLQMNRKLNVADANIAIQSFVHDGIRSHYTIHSRRMGYIIGAMLHNGATQDALDFVQTTVLPRQSDVGEPAPLARYHELSAKVGWRLAEIDLQLDPKARAISSDWDRSLPDPMLEIISQDRGKRLATTPCAENSMTAHWSTDFILWKDQAVRLRVVDDNFLTATRLGDRLLVGDQSPPKVLAADTDHGVYWSAKLVWEPVHY